MSREWCCQLLISEVVILNRSEKWNRGLLYERQGLMAEAIAAMQVCVDYFQEIGHVEADERAARLVALSNF